MTRHARPPAARRRLSILMLLSLLVSSLGAVVAAPISPASAATTQVVFTEDATCIIADGVSRITVELWGGGGGGGNKTSGNNAGSGGGGGAYAGADFVVTPGQEFTIEVGAGGGPQNDGGLSRFSLTESMATVNIVANGGKAGGERSNTNSNVGPGGAKSTAAPGSESDTLVSKPGGAGGSGSSGGSRSGGGGGGSATSVGPGDPGEDATSVGGTGGTGQGSGGNGSSSGDGSSGNAPGGGGGGGGGPNVASGGAGARGEVRISSAGSGPVPCVGEPGSGGDDTVPGSGDPVDPVQETLDVCSAASHNGLTVAAGHGEILYVDTGQSQRLDSAYLAYRVTSTTARSDLWVEVSGPGLEGNIRLVNASQSAVPLGEVGVGDAGGRSAFFLVRSDGGTAEAQEHTVRVYRSDPRVGSPEPLYHCKFTIKRVDETIKAGANKVDVIATTTAVRLGDTYTITVEGDSGTIGAGNDDDKRMIWVSPASRSDWPVGALRLERTEVTLFSDAGLTRVLSSHVDTLRINEETGLTTKNRQYYRAVYTFRVIGTAAAPVPIVPAAMISSGRQIKHTDASAFPKFAVDITEPTVELEVDKTAEEGLDVDNAADTAEITYSITVTNKGDSALTVDAIVDTPDDDLEFVPGSATLDGSAILNPAEAGGDLSFSGPISVAAGATRTLSYRMSFSFDACDESATPSFTNTAFARVGDVIVGASETAKPKVSVTVTCGSDGTPSPTLAVVDDADETVPPQVQTLPAMDIATTDPATVPSTTEARLNALVDPNGTAGLKVRFRYSTDAGLASPQDVLLLDTTDATAAYGVSALLSGLDHATPYYFRIEVYDPVSDEATVFGETLSFTTPPEPGSPLAATGAATDRTSTTAVLTGTIDPRRNTSQVQFEWVEKGSACPAPGATITPSISGPLEDEEEEEVIELDGAAPVTMTFEAAGLNPLEDYCFRIVALHGADFESRIEGEWEPFTTLGVQVVTLAVATGGTQTLEVDAVQELDAESNKASVFTPVFTFTSEDPEFCSIVVDAGTTSVKAIAPGTCTIRVDESGTDDIEPAFATLTFTVQGASQLAFKMQPTGAVAGEGIAPAVEVRIEDAGGDLVTSSTAAVTLAIRANPGAGTLAGTLTVDAVGGIATFSDLSIGKAGTGYMLRATSTDLTGAVSAAFDIVAGAADDVESDIVASPDSDVTADGSDSSTLAITVRDANGNLVEDEEVFFSITDGAGGSLSLGPWVTDVSGVATATLASTSAATLTVTGYLGTDAAGTSVGTATVAFVAGSANAAQSTIAADPATGVVADGAETSTLTITARDANSNPVGGKAVFFTITGGSGGTLSSGPWTTDASGVATATLTSITAATLTVTGYLGEDDEGASVGSTTVAFVAGDISTAANGSLLSGSDLSRVADGSEAATITVQLRDVNGNDIAESGVAVGFSTTRGTLSSASEKTNAGGLATVTLTSTEAGTAEITATVAGFAVANGSPVTVTFAPGTATKLAITTPPVGASSGSALATQPVVVIQDAQGNTVTSDSETVVTLALEAGADGAVGGTLTATAVNGVATFAGVTLSGVVGTSYTLRFSSGSLTPADATDVQVSGPGTASQLALATEAAGAASGAAFTTQPVVEVRDAQGNVTASTAVVTMTVSEGGTVVGTVTVAAVAGVATFTDVGISGTAVTSYTLTFASGSLTEATQTISLGVGAATGLVITTQPSATSAIGAAFTTQPVVRLRDSGGNDVSQADVEVTVAIATGDGTLSGTLTATTDASGVATFSGLVITGTVGVRTLTFTATGLAAATSTGIDVTAGAAAEIAIQAGDAQSAEAGEAVTIAPSVVVRDADGNPVPGVEVTFAVASGGGTVDPTTAVTTDADGIAAVTSWTLGATAGENTLTATSGTLTGSPLTFTATGATSGPGEIDFEQPTTPIVYGAAPFTITATSTSGGTPTGLLVVFSGTPDVCEVSVGTLAGGVTTATVTVLGAGSCVLAANQAGDATYGAAPEQTRTVVIEPKLLTITAGTLSGSKVYDAGTAIPLTGSAGLSGLLAGDVGSVELTGMPTVGTLDTMFVGESRPITVAPLTTVSLTGDRAANYLLDPDQTSLEFTTGTVTRRPLTIAPDPRTVLVAVAGTITVCPVSDTTSSPDGLQGSDAIESPSDRPCVLDPGGEPISIAVAGTFDVTPTFADITIRQGVLDVTDQYDITLGVGVLTVESLPLPTMSASDIELTYGDPFTVNLLGADATDGVTTLVTGGVTLSYSFPSGGALDARRDAGDHVIDITFPGDAAFGTQTIRRTVTVLPRALTITVADAVKVAGESDPAFGLTYDGFVLGEDESVLSAVSVTRAAGETPGTYTLTPGGTSTNYAITPVSGELLIVGLTIGVQESGGVLTDREVTCVCELLEPASAVTLTIFSTPTVIATTTVAADGTCPGFGGIIPDSVPDGPHTLRIDGTAGDAGATPVSLSRAVNLTSGDGPVIGSGGVGSTSTPPPTPPTPPGSGGSSSPLTPPSSLSPLVPPEDRTRTPAPSIAPTTPAPAPANPPATPAPPREQPQVAGPPTADAPRGTVLGGAPADTVDLGARGAAGAPAVPPDATLREVLEVTRTAAARTLEDLSAESLSGFASGVGLRIEVIGARTTARFVLSATERIDTLVLSEALRRSAPTQATDFASISAAAPVDVPAPVRPWSPQERTQADDLFAASRLPAPVLLSDLAIPGDATWIRIEMQGATYLPGSLVHLTVTSDPVVLASAAVRRDGTVTIVGDLPVEILPAGEHRIRLVGTRVLRGIETDADGEIVLPEDVLAEIARFDLGTDATVRVVGDNGTGGVHTALRVVPLDPVPPWWTLWIVLVAWLGATVLRRRGRLDGMRRRAAAHVVVLIAGAPAVVLGWLATTTVVVWWGAGLALLATLVLGAIVPREDEDRDAGAAALSAGA